MKRSDQHGSHGGGRRGAVGTALVCALALSGCRAGGESASGADPVFALERDIVAERVDEPSTQSIAMPAFELRLALQSMLTEHATLSNEAMRRAIDGGDVEATLTELTRNTNELTLAIGLVYGPAGASAFDQLWTNHIEFFNSYARAIRSGDDGAAADVRDHLGHYEHDFSDFVEVATGGELEFETVLQVLHSHVGQLLAQADAWESGDYDAATKSAVDAFEHMDTIAAAIATAIAAQQPDRFPGSIDDQDQTNCAAARLAASALIVAGADVELADRADSDDSWSAAHRAFAVAKTEAAERVGDEAIDQLISAMSVYGGATSVATARARLLADVDRTMQVVCAVVT